MNNLLVPSIVGCVIGATVLLWMKRIDDRLRRVIAISEDVATTSKDIASLSSDVLRLVKTIESRTSPMIAEAQNRSDDEDSDDETFEMSRYLFKRSLRSLNSHDPEQTTTLMNDWNHTFNRSGDRIDKLD